MPKTIVVPPGTTAPIAPFSPGTLADGIVYVSGTLAFDKDNNVVHVGDFSAQTRHVLETIKSVIETAGGTMDDVTFNSIFIKDWAYYAALNKVYAEYLGVIDYIRKPFGMDRLLESVHKALESPKPSDSSAPTEPKD